MESPFFHGVEPRGPQRACALGWESERRVDAPCGDKALWQQDELLHPPVLGAKRRDLSYIEIAFRIGGHVMQGAELTRRRAPFAEAVEELEPRRSNTITLAWLRLPT